MTNKNPRPRAKERACDTSVKRTLAYRAVFKYPLTFHQLSTYLISKRDFEHDFFTKSVRRLVKKKHIKTKDETYYLPGVRPLSWQARFKNTQELLAHAMPAIKLIGKIPWIKMIGITGSVATFNAKPEDDIDLFIVTQKNRVWITRFFVFLILKSLGMYAQGKKNKRKLCCNLFIDESEMMWAKEKQNVYVAHEIVHLMPVVNKSDTYFEFIGKNKWALKHFPNFKIHIEDSEKNNYEGSRLVDFVDNHLHKLQLNYMKNKKTKEITTKKLIHFNKNDHTRRIISEYKRNLKSL